MKTYILRVRIGTNDTFQLTIDTTQPNLAYHILTAGCQASLRGFGDAKSTLLGKLIVTGGVLEYSHQGVQYTLNLEVFK